MAIDCYTILKIEKKNPSCFTGLVISEKVIEIKLSRPMRDNEGIAATKNVALTGVVICFTSRKQKNKKSLL